MSTEIFQAAIAFIVWTGILFFVIAGAVKAGNSDLVIQQKNANRMLAKYLFINGVDADDIRELNEGDSDYLESLP